MKKFSALLPAFCSLCAVLTVASASAGTLTFDASSSIDKSGSATLVTNPANSGNADNAYTSTTFTGVGSTGVGNYTFVNGMPVTFVFSGGSYNLSFSGENSGVAKTPVLSGSAGDLKVTSVNNGSMIRVKTLVSVSNTGTKAAKNVSATIYLSDDATLDTKDTKIKMLYLKDYASDAAKLLKGQTLSLPVKQKVPAAIASYLDGKYLIAVLSADNAANPFQVVVGPIQLPTSK